MKPTSPEARKNIYAEYDTTFAELKISHENHGHLGSVFVNEPEMLGELHGCTVEVDQQSGTGTLRPQVTNSERRGDSGDKLSSRKVDSKIAHKSEHEEMSTQDRYIDARLAGIESKLDARMDAMQRFQEQAEARFQRATERHETDIALTRQQIHEEFRDARKHSTNTAWATVGGVFAVMAVIVALGGYWISEQGSYAKSYGDTQVEIQRATDERAEFREAVQSIQQTQQSILERLPAPQEPTEQ